MTQLAEYGLSGIAIGLIIFMGYTFNLFIKFAKEQMKEGSKQQEHLRQTIEKNTKVNDQTYQLLKNLNGRLREAYDKKISGK